MIKLGYRRHSARVFENLDYSGTFEADCTLLVHLVVSRNGLPRKYVLW